MTNSEIVGLDYSNFELNRAVARKLGMCTDKSLLPPHAIDSGYSERYPDTVWARAQGEPWEQVVWTNDPEQWANLMFWHHIAVDWKDEHVIATRRDCKTCGDLSPPIILERSEVGRAICLAFINS